MKLRFQIVALAWLVLTVQDVVRGASFDLGQDVFLDPSKKPRAVVGLDAPVSRRGRGLQQYNPAPLSPTEQQVVNTVNSVVDGTVDPASLGLSVDQTTTNIQMTTSTGAPLTLQQTSQVSQAVGTASGAAQTFVNVKNGVMIVTMTAEPAKDLASSTSTSNTGRRLLQTSIPQKYAVVGKNTTRVKIIQANLNRILNNPTELSSIASTVVPGVSASTSGTFDPANSPKVSAQFTTLLYLTSNCSAPDVKDYAKNMCNQTLVEAGQTAQTAECTPRQKCGKVGIALFGALSRAQVNVTLDYIAYATNVINAKTAKNNAAKIEAVVNNTGTMTYLSNQLYQGSRVTLS